MNKCVLILPYFGKFNNYFDKFLRSCGYNNQVDWLIFTDDRTSFDYPANVLVNYCSFNDFVNLVQQKFMFSIKLKTPYKLCDYKPAYGYIFEDVISKYEYWGHCDCDLLFGNLNKLLIPLLDGINDKIFAAGHLTIYKNTRENNRIFMNSYKGKILYKEAFTQDNIFVLDEDCVNDENVHSLFLEAGKNVVCSDLSCNIVINKPVLIRTIYDCNIRKFVPELFSFFRYYFDNGELYRIRRRCKEEFLYIHLQGRKMVDHCQNYNAFEITPNKFIKKRKFHFYSTFFIIINRMIIIDIQKILKKIRKC